MEFKRVIQRDLSHSAEHFAAQQFSESLNNNTLRSG